MTRDSAQRIMDATLEAHAALVKVVVELRNGYGREEAKPFVHVAAAASYDLYDLILRPLVNEHPEVRPEGFPVHPADPKLVLVRDHEPSEEPAPSTDDDTEER